ncbi:uncharacterized protein L201_004985 [Kwoniella dendrophila CBS 6074]|uniref:Uncharacterized protein n=1 Tax=Kwoniella dendrophila CBS 6074 TaxID=1295534 RepID=A0AAX4JYU9_9TREE
MSDHIELKPMGKSAPLPPPPVPPRHPATNTNNNTSSLGDSLPGSLGKAYRTAEEKAKAAVHLQEGGLDAISIWGLGLAAWYSILALPLLLFPRILLFFSQTPSSSSSTSNLSVNHNNGGREEHYDNLTNLESTLCLIISFGLFTISLISIFSLVPTYTSDINNPSRKSILGILVGLTSLSGLIIWNSNSIGGLNILLGGSNILLSIWGWWTIIFGSNGTSKLTKKNNNNNNNKNSKNPERFKRL